MIGRMAGPRGQTSVGRPSKGDRWLVSTRLPVAMAEEFRHLAEVQDLSYSELLANIVAEHLGHAKITQPRDTSAEERLIA